MRISTLLLAAMTGGLLLCDAASGQCSSAQGNAELQLSGLGQVGSTLRVRVVGEPYAPFVLAYSTDSSPQAMAGGTVCLGPSPKVILNGLGHIPGQPPPNQAFRLSALGEYRADVAIPGLGTLIGTEVFFQAVIADANSPTGGGYAISELESITLSGPGPVTTIFFEDFETGMGNWYATNGLWQAGVPANGPASAWGGSQCAGTDLNANYPSNGANTTLVSPVIALPALNSGEEIRVRYREWFDSEDVNDKMQFRISEDGGVTWSTLPHSRAQSGWSHVWSQASVDLSAYAGKSVQLGFHFSSTDGYYARGGNGFFLDDVEVFAGLPHFAGTETFEAGIDHWWSSDNGLWQVGAPGPSCGPANTPSGLHCAATVLDGLYPSSGADTRLISASIALPAGTPQTLFFEHWFDTEDNTDKGWVQVSTDGGQTWVTEAGEFSGIGHQWTQVGVPLGAYAGQEILISFYFTSTDGYYSRNGCGWYLDDIRIQ